MIIHYYEELPSPSEQSTRIYELERALQHIIVSLVGARNSLDYPRDHVSPYAAKVQVERALKLIREVL